MDVIFGMFGEDIRNTSFSRLVSFLIEAELIFCNIRTFVSEPEWTGVMDQV